MAFLQDVGGFLQDLGGSVTGGTTKDLYQQQLAAQNQMNAQIFALEQERMAQMQTPEYRKQQTLKLVAVVVLFMGVIFLSYKLLVK